MERSALEKLFALNVPATTDSVREAETQLAMPLPQDYKEFLSISNGLTTNRLVLLEAEDIASRNADYEIQEYLPGYLMIGDDSGGMAVLMCLDDSMIYEVGMGTMDLETMSFSASSLSELLLTHGGHLLGQRR